MRAAGVQGRPTTKLISGRPTGQRLSILSVLALVLGALAALTSAPPAQAAQAPGHDVPVYANGWSWTYATTFTYNDGAGTTATLNENVTYTVAGTQTFNGQDAYRLNITGNITGGSGRTEVDGIGTVNLSNFSGSVSGTRYVRRADLALLQESQQQHLNGDAKYSIFTIDVTADIDLTLTPNPAWRTHDFPLNGGDSWHSDTDVAYTGGFNYSSSVASGNGPFDGTLEFDAPVTVSTGSVSVPAGNIATDNISATSSDGTVDNHWWSPAHKADARHFMSIPMDDGAVATIDRRLSGSNTPAPATAISETITPSLACAGGPVTVSGKVGNTTGTPVQIAIDKGAIGGGKVITNTTTGANGNYSATITAPVENDGMGKNGSRANWGVLVSGGGATNVATLVVTHQNCSTLAYTGASAAPTGTNATVSATLTDLGGASPAGRLVTFSLSGGGSTSATTNGSGVATATLPITGNPRTATVTASYAGSAALAAASTTASFEVGQISTSTSVLASPSMVTIGDDVSFTATVTPTHGGTPTGTVQFKVNGNNFGAAAPLTGDTATSSALDSGTLGLGDHTVSAVYSGDTTRATSTSPVVTFKVRNAPLATTTTSNVAPLASVYGEDVTLSAHVSSASPGTPTGEVTFTRGATVLATAPVDGSGDASVTIDTLPVGGYGIVATYTGDDTFGSSTAGAKNVTVAKAGVDVELGSSDTTTVSGESVSFGVIVTSQSSGGEAPQGTVQLRIDGNDVGSPVVLTGGSASFPAVDTLLAGSHTVAVEYSGSANHQDGSDTLTQEVSQAGTTTVVTSSPSPSNEGSNVVFTALVSADAPGSGTPTGTVTFKAGSEVIGAAPLEVTAAGTTATLEYADLDPGSYLVEATYDGDTSYLGSVGSGSHTVQEGVAIVGTTTSLTSTKNPSTYGELVGFTAEVAADDGSTPSGSVQFSVDGADFGSPVQLVDGVAESAMLASPEPGDHTVIAAFTPDAGYSGSGWFVTQTVATAGVEVALSSSAPNADHGDPVRFTAEVTSTQIGTETPTGFVQFRVDGQPFGNAVEVDADGVAQSAVVSNLAPGDHTVTALYSGDARFSPGTDTLTQGVAKVGTGTTLAVSATSTGYGQPVTLTATVTADQAALGAPTGTVTFTDGSTTLGTVAVVQGSGAASTASLTLSNLAAGSHTIRASYSGTPSFEASQSGTRTVTVAKQATTLTADAALVKLNPLGLPLGQLKATVTAATGPVAGVPVEFVIGKKTVCVSNTNAQGVAECNALPHLLELTLALGYKASFAGDANYVGSSDRGGIIK